MRWEASSRVCLLSLSERGEHARVVFEEDADVVDVVAHHGDPLDPDPEGPAGDRLRVVAGLAQDVGWTIPEPPISIQPEPPQVRQVSLLPPQPGQVVSTSALGSVKGKNEGRNRTACLGPKSSRQSPVRLPLRWPKWIPSATSRPSIWWNMYEWRASTASRR